MKRADIRKMAQYLRDNAHRMVRGTWGHQCGNGGEGCALTLCAEALGFDRDVWADRWLNRGSIYRDPNLQSPAGFLEEQGMHEDVQMRIVGGVDGEAWSAEKCAQFIEKTVMPDPEPEPVIVTPDEHHIDVSLAVLKALVVASNIESPPKFKDLVSV